jgi:hypothetical protein
VRLPKAEEMKKMTMMAVIGCVDTKSPDLLLSRDSGLFVG